MKEATLISVCVGGGEVQTALDLRFTFKLDENCISKCSRKLISCLRNF